MSLPVAEIRSASMEAIGPNDGHSNGDDHWLRRHNSGDASSKRGSFKRTQSEVIEMGSREELPQKKKLSRFLSFFRKSKSSKPEFGKQHACETA